VKAALRLKILLLSEKKISAWRCIHTGQILCARNGTPESIFCKFLAE
jgi:hypothetical protein